MIGKFAFASLLFVVIAVASSAQNFDDAVKGVSELKDKMRDPESFQVEKIFFFSGENAKRRTEEYCVTYRSRNGFGGMNRDEARFYVRTNLKTGEKKTLLEPEAHRCGQDHDKIRDITVEFIRNWERKDQ